MITKTVLNKSGNGAQNSKSVKSSVKKKSQVESTQNSCSPGPKLSINNRSNNSQKINELKDDWKKVIIEQKKYIEETKLLVEDIQNLILEIKELIEEFSPKENAKRLGNIAESLGKFSETSNQSIKNLEDLNREVNLLKNFYSENEPELKDQIEKLSKKINLLSSHKYSNDIKLQKQ